MKPYQVAEGDINERERKTYEMVILTKVINDDLDERIPFTEDGLKVLVAERDQIVWNIATKIYSQSGYKLDFYFIRDLLTSRTGELTKYIEAEKATVYNRLRAEEKANYERLQSEKAKEIARKIEERQELERLSQQLEDFGRDKSMSYLYLKLLKIISNQLGVDFSTVKLDSHIAYDLGADGLDTVELSIELSENFNYEIDIPETLLGCTGISSSSFFGSGCGSDPVACTVGELLDFMYESLPKKWTLE